MTATRIAAGLLLPALLCPSLVLAQSLGEAAKKEQERRKKNRQAGVQAKVITEEELAGARGAAGAARPAAAGEAPAGPAEPGPATPPAAAPAAAGDDRAEQEEYWRGRAAAARADVARLEEVVRELEKLWLVEGESYVDDGGKTVIRDLAHLREIVARAKADLSAARRALDNLEDEARRKGALPGWLR